MSPKNRYRLYKKLKYYSQFKQVGGYITPVEFIYIIGKFSIDNHKWEAYIRSEVKKGETKPSWYYFELDQTALERI